MNYVWWYIQSSTEAELIENRAAMMKKPKISEQEFVLKHWQPKEDRFVSAFTKSSLTLVVTVAKGQKALILSQLRC